MSLIVEYILADGDMVADLNPYEENDYIINTAREILASIISYINSFIKKGVFPDPDKILSAECPTILKNLNRCKCETCSHIWYMYDYSYIISYTFAKFAANYHLIMFSIRDLFTVLNDFRLVYEYDIHPTFKKIIRHIEHTLKRNYINRGFECLIESAFAYFEVSPAKIKYIRDNYPFINKFACGEYPDICILHYIRLVIDSAFIHSRSSESVDAYKSLLALHHIYDDISDHPSLDTVKVLWMQDFARSSEFDIDNVPPTMYAYLPLDLRPETSPIVPSF